MVSRRGALGPGDRCVLRTLVISHIQLNVSSITGEDNLVEMTKTFDVLAELSLPTEEFGEGQDSFRKSFT